MPSRDSTGAAPLRPRRPASERESAADVAMAGLGVEVGLRTRMPRASKRVHDRDAPRVPGKSAGDVVRLIEPARPLPPRVQRHGHQQRARTDQIACITCQKPRERGGQPPALVVLHRVNEIAQHVLVPSDGATARQGAVAGRARMTPASGRHRLAASIAQRWRERAKVPPARVTRRRSRRRIEHGMARDAQRREKRGDHGVRSSMGVAQCRHSSIVNRHSEPLPLLPERLPADAE